ncbi:MAG TPA: response regulator [Candidatus Methylacidiphilales bacterium]|nr:response regulator [Candidatus Methylacidiphilales bacterium]
MRILTLDDQPGLADMLALSLRTLGHAAKGFTSPGEALASIQDFDVLVTDYDMPEMNGLEVAQQAYAGGWKGALLIMSGRSAVINGAIEHPLLRIILSKPFSTQELVEALPVPK